MAAAVVVARRLLLVAKQLAPEIHYLPGGKPEPGEAPLECLRREIAEELRCHLRQPRLLADVRGPAALEGVDMHMTVYLAGLAGTPTPAAEIASLVWWPHPRVTLAPTVRDHVIPLLHRRQLLPATAADRHGPGGGP